MLNYQLHVILKFHQQHLCGMSSNTKNKTTLVSVTSRLNLLQIETGQYFKLVVYAINVKSFFFPYEIS